MGEGVRSGISHLRAVILQRISVKSESPAESTSLFQDWDGLGPGRVRGGLVTWRGNSPGKNSPAPGDIPEFMAQESSGGGQAASPPEEPQMSIVQLMNWE